MSFVEILSWVALGCLPAFLVLDFFYGARTFETPRFWRLRATLVTLVAIALSFVVPTFWVRVFGNASLFDLSPLGTWGGAAAGILVYQFFHYWYHRAVHRNDRLWRALHQMHHSAESLDAWGAYFISPADAAMFISITTIVFAPVLGLSPEAAAIGNLFLTFNAVFQHANLRTPRWIGYLIQRPESHAVHHERGVHAYNYADLALWDMVFGTWKNPPAWDGQVGFWNGASARIADMLLMRDVATPPAEAEPEGQATQAA